MTGTVAQRIAAAAPLALFLAVIGFASWAGRDQLKAAVEASGAFVAAQFGQGRPVQPSVDQKATPVKGPTSTGKAAAGAAIGPGAGTSSEVTQRVIVEIEDKGRKLQILDVPIPEDCYPQQHTDYAGDAVVWGLGHKRASAAECCQACRDHQLKAGGNMPCNIWVWCGDPSGICWTMEINHQGAFSADFRAVHRTAPEFVPWVAGVVPVKAKTAATARRRLRTTGA
ncbi:hypothetical protein VOLCADRAFT_105646 [Volvox carteri f. nagariensis]|uniref:Apple domain-containing protein n=1 Tax=Volvox carteri f. nagariensis TaxID=3068 RepID=D8U225_VOLCA|nr:uncharacterized protein VOLCADRAFT_105646 [Volvox carteri f. nagariensis]EFJ46289.1 hypothetical protein VOLCADRAFT_105646 [Volvox carteri f. nagariensis]|eukprot:XP_002952736.1 hypothetical protein VOLCADRAFT_105646 [Volvox carteri f. nagariensis]